MGNINMVVEEAGISIAQLIHLFLGKHLVLLAIVAGATFLLAARNQVGSSDGYGISEYVDSRVFIGISIVVSLTHFFGLISELYTGELVLSGHSVANAILIVLCGAMPGLLIYIFAYWIQEHKENQIKNRQYYRHLHKLGRKQDVERSQKFL